MAEASRPLQRKATARAVRTERLATALRDNLRRRKEQARAQQELASSPSREPAKKDSEGEGEPAA